MMTLQEAQAYIDSQNYPPLLNSTSFWSNFYPSYQTSLVYTEHFIDNVFLKDQPGYKKHYFDYVVRGILFSAKEKNSFSIDRVMLRRIVEFVFDPTHSKYRDVSLAKTVILSVNPIVDNYGFTLDDLLSVVFDVLSPTVLRTKVNRLLISTDKVSKEEYQKLSPSVLKKIKDMIKDDDFRPGMDNIFKIFTKDELINDDVLSVSFIMYNTNYWYPIITPDEFWYWAGTDSSKIRFATVYYANVDLELPDDIVELLKSKLTGSKYLTTFTTMVSKLTKQQFKDLKDVVDFNDYDIIRTKDGSIDEYLANATEVEISNLATTSLIQNSFIREETLIKYPQLINTYNNKWSNKCYISKDTMKLLNKTTAITMGKKSVRQKWKDAWIDFAYLISANASNDSFSKSDFVYLIKKTNATNVNVLKTLHDNNFQSPEIEHIGKILDVLGGDR